jgi:hypothetical protein
MPFCRKCGRRLVEYSEECTDCGTSTTAPLINTKRIQSSHLFRAAGPAKIARAMIPEVSPVKIKVITDKPTKAVTSVRAVASPKAVAAAKAAISLTVDTPIKIATPPKAVAPPKPVLSAKHIVKPKKVTQTKPTAPFTIAFARPVASHTLVQRKPVGSPRPVAQPIAAVQPTVAPAQPVTPPNPIAQPAPIAQPTPIMQLTPVVIPIKPVTQAKPFTPTIPIASSKPITLAPVYPPHEIIKSNASLKVDIIAHPEDYERQSFEFTLRCPNGHYWRHGKDLPVSKGIAYCLKCGERLSKPKTKKRRNFHRY